MNKNEAVVILSHANSDEKIKILKECISTSKKNGYQVILSSSSPVSDEIQKEVDYFLFDKENPVITGDELSKIGVHCEMKNIREIEIDKKYNIITAPCYMMNASISEVRNNIKTAIEALKDLI